MSTTDELRVSGYQIVAEVRGHDVLWFREFGSYQGEWLLFSRDAANYYIWRGSFGSCSGCDHFQSHFSGDGPYSRKYVEDFTKDYQPFLKLRPDAALNIARREGNLLAVLPRNRRDWYDIPQETVGRQLALIVKGMAGEISSDEVLEIDNQEARREAIEKMGSAEFVGGLRGAHVIEETDEGTLYRIPREGSEDFAFIYVKDPSTERRYVIRVAPQHQTVRAARASTFGFSAEEFELAQET